MEEVYFVLGMVTILLVLGVMIVFTVKKKIKEMEMDLEKLEKEIQYLERSSNDVSNDIHRRIEDEVRELNTKIDYNEREIFSRLDKKK